MKVRLDRKTCRTVLAATALMALIAANGPAATGFAERAWHEHTINVTP